MTKQVVLEGFDQDTVDFDIDKFQSQLFNTIESLRSQMSLQVGQVVENPIENSSSHNSESKLNTFYRLLGFPAVRSDTGHLPQEVANNRNALSQHNTLNYFDDFNINGESVADKAAARENALYEKVDYQRSVDIIQTPLLFNVSIDGSPRRPSIFPLVVHAAIPVFPTNRRTAPLFYDGDFILLGDQRRLSRPFLEHIIYMRTKVFAGFETYSDDLKKQITKEFDDTTLAGKELQTSLLKNVDQKEFLGLKIINKLLRALKFSADQYRDTIENIERLRKDVQFVPVAKSNPEERSGNLPDSIVANLQVDNISEKGIESEITAIKAKMAAEDIFINLLPSEFIKKSDNIKRIEDEVQNNTIADDVFLSEFNFITTYEKDVYSNQLKELEDKRARLISDYELEKQSLMYLNGELTGLSIFDVICILLALFTVDLASLLAIINRGSLSNLQKSDLFYKTNPGSSTPSQSTQIFRDIRTDIADILSTDQSLQIELGLQDIQQKVKENFQIAEAFSARAQKSGDNRE